MAADADEPASAAQPRNERGAADTPARTAIRREAERVHEAATYSAETQFEFAKRWRRVDRWIGSLAAGLAAIAGVGGLSTVLSAKWAGLIAVLAALTGAIAAAIGAPQTKEKASVAANSYRALQQDARIFLQIDLAGCGSSVSGAAGRRLLVRDGWPGVSAAYPAPAQRLAARPDRLPGRRRGGPQPAAASSAAMRMRL
jgi:hypothetical protein